MKTDRHENRRAGSNPKRKRVSKARTKFRDGSKSAKIIELLRRSGGATIQELGKVTGWQPHSIRGFLSGTLRKKSGFSLSSFIRKDGTRAYRLARH